MAEAQTVDGSSQKGGHVSLAWVVVAVACLIAAETSFTQTVDAGDAPPEVTILKHGWSFERRFTSKAKSDPQNANDESMSQVMLHSAPFLSVKVRNNTTKKITGVTWYLVLIKPGSEEEVARMRFSSHTEIGAKKTGMVKGKLERWPRAPGAVTVDELKTEVVGPPKERVQISCLLFADGSFSSLKGSSNSDCHGEFFAATFAPNLDEAAARAEDGQPVRFNCDDGPAFAAHMIFQSAGSAGTSPCTKSLVLPEPAPESVGSRRFQERSPSPALVGFIRRHCSCVLVAPDGARSRRDACAPSEELERSFQNI